MVAWDQGEVQGRELEARGAWVRRLQKVMGKVFGVMGMFTISTAVLVSRCIHMGNFIKARTSNACRALYVNHMPIKHLEYISIFPSL